MAKLKIPPGLLKEASQVEDRGRFSNESAESLARMLRGGSARALQFEQFRQGGVGGLGVGNVGQNAPTSKPFDAAAAIVDQITRDSGVSFESLPLEQQRALFNTADRVLLARDQDKGPLGFLTEGKFAIPAILGGGLALGLSGAGAGAGSVGANVGGTSVGATAPAAGAGNLIAAAPTTAVTAQTGGATQAFTTPAFSGGLGGGTGTAAGLSTIDLGSLPGAKAVPAGASGTKLGGISAIATGANEVANPILGGILDIGKQVAGSAVGGLVGRGLNELFGPDAGDITGPLRDALSRAEQAPLITAGGLRTDREDGRLTVTPLAGRQSIVDQLSGQFGTGAGEIADLRSQVTPGFGRLSENIDATTEARLADLTNQRLRTVGNLRENLARRRIGGSSFASDTLARANAEFAQERDRILADAGERKSRAFLEEIALSGQLLEREQQFKQAQFDTKLRELNLEAELGKQLATAGQNAFSQLSAALSKANSLIAQGEMQSINTFAGIGREIFA